MRASKYYAEQELWFFTLPTSLLIDTRPGHLVILLENEKTASAFHLLKVPFAFFRENRAKFDTRNEGDKFDMHISARRGSWMDDLRSKGVSFGQFCI